MTTDLQARFELTRRPKADAAGEIIRGEDRDSGHAVDAILVGGGVEGEERRHRFLLRAEKLASLNKRSFADVLATGTYGEHTAAAVLAVPKGDDLGDRLRLEPPGTAGELLGLLGQLLAALDLLHGAGLVHGNLGPRSIVLSGGGRFGYPILNRFVLVPGLTPLREPKAGAQDLALATSLLSPEQLANPEEPLLPSDDLYALGIIVFTALAGSPPFSGSTAAITRRAVLAGKPTRLGDARPDLPDDFASCVDRAIDPDRSARYVDATAMRRALMTAAFRSPDLRKLMLRTPSDESVAERPRASFPDVDTRDHTRPFSLDGGTRAPGEAAPEAMEIPTAAPRRGIEVTLTRVAQREQAAIAAVEVATARGGARANDEDDEPDVLIASQADENEDDPDMVVSGSESAGGDDDEPDVVISGGPSSSRPPPLQPAVDARRAAAARARETMAAEARERQARVRAASAQHAREQQAAAQRAREPQAREQAAKEKPAREPQPEPAREPASRTSDRAETRIEKRSAPPPADPTETHEEPAAPARLDSEPSIVVDDSLSAPPKSARPAEETAPIELVSRRGAVSGIEPPADLDDDDLGRPARRGARAWVVGPLMLLLGGLSGWLLAAGEIPLPSWIPEEVRRAAVPGPAGAQALASDAGTASSEGEVALAVPTNTHDAGVDAGVAPSIDAGTLVDAGGVETLDGSVAEPLVVERRLIYLPRLPGHTRITIDDETVEGDQALALEVPDDGMPHVLTIRAPGFERIERELAPGIEGRFDVTLEPAERSRRRRHRDDD